MLYFDFHINLTNFCSIYLCLIQLLLVYSGGFFFCLLGVVQSKETSENNIFKDWQ